MFIAPQFACSSLNMETTYVSTNRGMDKQDVIHVYVYIMKYYSAIKKNTFESVLMRWVKLEPIIQSEVSRKEKHQYSILTLIYGI